jgi:SAM-dependent methyltransferase
MQTLREVAGDARACLDLGCGSQFRYRSFIEAHGLEWYGADVVALEKADANYRSVVNNRLDFEDDSFDVVCAFNVIEHFTCPEIMFSEVRRCLREGGIFCGACAFWEFEHDSYFHLSRKGLLEILSRHGFELVSVTPSEYSGAVLDAQRFFGGSGTIVKSSKRARLHSTLLCSLNWVPFLITNTMEFARRQLRPLDDPFKNCATLYFYARKVTRQPG